MKYVPIKRVLYLAEVHARLGREVTDDAIRAGWLKPCCTKNCLKRDRHFYALRDVEAIEDRMINGEYPQPR